MKSNASIKGFDEVMRNLNAEIQRIENQSMAGLIEASIDIFNWVETEVPKIPVDTGNLRHSKFTSSVWVNRNPALFFGYNANYALWVHEMVDADFHREGSGAKFLESKLKNHTDDILKTIRDNVKIP